MKTQSTIVKMTLTCSLLLLSIGAVLAQPGSGGSGGPGTPTPFGFLELLISAGVLYGGKKAYEAQNNKEES